MEKYFYVYKWFNTETNEVFYIGKGCKNRYKETSRRNKNFLDYYNSNPCQSEIIEYFDTEEEAFKKEYQLIQEYRLKGQAQTNLDDGGKGGCHFVWTEQMRDYWSRNNPMKTPEQRQRMSENNPMYNPEIAKQVGLKHRKAVVIAGIEYDGIITAAKELGVSDLTITNWCNKGHNGQGQLCYYLEGEKKKIKRSTDRAVFIDDQIFNTITDAAAYLDCSASNLGKALREGKTTYKKHKCGYANQQPSQENSNNSILEGSTTNE